MIYSQSLNTFAILPPTTLFIYVSLSIRGNLSTSNAFTSPFISSNLTSPSSILRAHWIFCPCFVLV